MENAYRNFYHTNGKKASVQEKNRQNLDFPVHGKVCKNAKSTVQRKFRKNHSFRHMSKEQSPKA